MFGTGRNGVLPWIKTTPRSAADNSPMPNIAALRTTRREQPAEVEFLAFHEDAFDRARLLEPQVPPVRGEDGAALRHRPGSRLELAVEEFVEGGVAFRRIGEFRGVQPVFRDEGGDLRFRGGIVHALAVPAGEGGALDHRMQGQGPQRVGVAELQEALAVDLLGFHLAAVAVEVADRAHVPGS